MKKIDTQVKSFTRAIKKLYPGISDETAAEAVKALFILVIDFKLTEDEKTWSLFEAKLNDLAEEDEDGWAAEMINSRVERARPYYLKAVARNADPVPAIQAILDLSEQEACDIVNKLMEEKPSIPAPASDPFATNENEESKDEEKEEQYA